MYYDPLTTNLKAMYEAMEFAEASDTLTAPAPMTKPVDPGKGASPEAERAYVQELKKWFDYNAQAPAAPAKAKKPEQKMHKEATPGISTSEGSGVKLNVDALLQDGTGRYWVSPYDQVLFLYRRPTDTAAGEPVLHPDERQFSHSDKIWIYRKFIKPDGELSASGLEYMQRKKPQELEVIMDNFLDKIVADKNQGLPDNTLARSNMVIADEPLTESVKPQLTDKRFRQ